MALVDGNLTSQILAGLVGFSRPDLILLNGLFSVAGVGAWFTAMTLKASRRERLMTLLLCFLVDLIGVGIAVMFAYVLSVILSGEIIIIRAFGSLAVCSIGFLIMDVRLPLGNKLPWTLVSSGLIIAAIMELFAPARRIVPTLVTIEPGHAALALLLTVLVGFASIVPFAWVGEPLARHLEVQALKVTAGLVVIGIAALIAGIQLSPLFLAVAGIAASILLKRQRQNPAQSALGGKPNVE
jgi:hypothetical protein